MSKDMPATALHEPLVEKLLFSVVRSGFCRKWRLHDRVRKRPPLRSAASGRVREEGRWG